MTLTPTEWANTSAAAFDVTLTCYGGVTWTALDMDGYAEGALPNLAGWTDVSHLVKFSGNFVYERTGNTLHWRAQLSGRGYDENYFGIGKAIVMLRQISTPYAEAGAQGLWFVGQIMAGDHSDDNQHGGNWSRAVVGLEGDLERANAPRLAIGPTNLAADASVTASSTLATAAEEMGSGEFLGAIAEVGPSNAADGNLNTVWISQDVPGAATEVIVQGGYYFSKLFFTPIAGYDAAKVWWVEIRSSGGMDLAQNAGELWNHLGEVIGFGGLEGQWKFTGGGRGIICYSRADFEAYTGGAPEADWILELKTLAPTFVVDPTAGALAITYGLRSSHNLVAWSQDGAVVDPHTFPPPYPQDPGGLDNWSGPSLNLSTVPPGSCFRRKLAEPSTHTAANWEIVAQATPGDTITPEQCEWLLIEPQELSVSLSAAFDTGAPTTMHLTDTVGFPATGEAVCEGDDFAYSGKTATTLVIDATNPPSSNHAQGARVYPLVGDVAMNGWPCSQLVLLRRPGLSIIQDGLVLFQKSGEAPMTPPYPYDPEDVFWVADWDGNPWYFQNNASSTITLPLSGAAPDAPRWVRRVLVIINRMADGGRAKLNDMRLTLEQGDVTYGGTTVELENLFSATIAKYLLLNVYCSAGYGQLPAACFDSDNSVWIRIVGHGIIGAHATAIATYSAVLDDLARITGCTVDFRPYNVIAWRVDPWWPISDAGWFAPTAMLGAEQLRGQVQFSGQRPTEYGVVVHGRSADGMERFTAYFPPNAETVGTVVAHDDVVCTAANVRLLAESLYAKDGLQIRSGPQKATFVVKGVGEWLRPDQWLDLVTDSSSGFWQIKPFDDAIHIYGSMGWLVERVTWTWSQSGGAKRWEARVECRRFKRSWSGAWLPPLV